MHAKEEGEEKRSAQAEDFNPCQDKCEEVR